MSDYLAHRRGKQGEEMATRFLQEKGLTLVAKNYRHRRDEIDLVMRDRDTLVFVEVKLRRNANFGDPETFVDQSQAERIAEAADHYVHEMEWEGNIRFDIVAITLQPQITIEHFEDAFC
ncbi:MAG: YraN family protein [Tunicatimonas sp.]